MSPLQPRPVARTAALALLLVGGPLHAQGRARASAPRPETPVGAAPVVAAARATHAIRVDGRLDDADWAGATPVSGFTQVDPAEGAPVSEPTEVRILYDGEALYVGARLRDRGEVRRRLGRRDMDLGDADWFGVVLDSYHDHRTAAAFLVSAAGVKRDTQRAEAGPDDATWDAVWDAAVGVDSGGWAAELRIPFSQLRFDGRRLAQWGVQLERRIGRKSELAVFAFTPKAEQGGVARYGHLEGLRDIRAGSRLDVVPYSVAKADYAVAGDTPFRRRGARSVTAGLDLKYRASSRFVVDATVNPDFGQVEVDPALVNLSDVEAFYEERRPFFVEGAEIFRFGGAAVGPGAAAANVFYSRRVGRAPQLGAAQLGAPAATDLPSAANILGAAKLSGRTAGGWSLGVLDAVTGRADARWHGADGGTRREAAEPLTNYLAARAVRQARGGQTTVGGVLTGVTRRLDAPALDAALRSDAYVGGVDFRHEWARRSWSVSGFLAGSGVRGSAAAMELTQRASTRYLQRPDLAHDRLDPTHTSLLGYAAQLQLFKQAGRHWIGDVGVSATSPGYEVNDLGFLGRADLLNANARLVYRENRPGPVLRQWSVSGVGVTQYNYDGDRILTQFQLGASAQHRSFWGGSAIVAYSPERADDRLTRGGPVVRRPATVVGVASAYSDNRRRVWGSANANAERDARGTWNLGTALAVRLRPAESWNLSVGPSFQRGTTAAQYVTSAPDSTAAATFGRRYVFARLDQTTLGLETRLNVTVSPALSLQTYAQPFFSHGTYGEPAQLRAAGAYAFDVYGRDVGTRAPAAGGFRVDADGDGPAPSFAVPDRDFTVRSLRGNAVLRWEYRRGSTLYVAWQQSRGANDAAYEFRLGGATRDLLRARPDNVFVVKLSYWLDI
jgi:hypothetical protein